MIRWRSNNRLTKKEFKRNKKHHHQQKKPTITQKDNIMKLHHCIWISTVLLFLTSPAAAETWTAGAATTPTAFYDTKVDYDSGGATGGQPPQPQNSSTTGGGGGGVRRRQGGGSRGRTLVVSDGPTVGISAPRAAFRPMAPRRCKCKSRTMPKPRPPCLPNCKYGSTT
jgi:hypothetical protein